MRDGTRQIKERPILFSAPMVRAILDNRKTQTRRVMKLPDDVGAVFSPREFVEEPGKWLYNGHDFKCPYGKVGERLWVRETCRAEELESGLDGVRYAADGSFCEIENSQEASDCWGKLWIYGKGSGLSVPSIHMPRWASRILLEIDNIRVERLNEISESDAIAEGIHKFHDLEMYGYDPNGTPGPMIGGSAAEAFYHLWQSINGDGSWESNPFVWVVEFKRIPR